MRRVKVTYINEVNGLSAEFSVTTPLMFFERMDGCSVGARAATYEPLEYDGQLLLSSTLKPRTIPLTVNVGGKSGGLYSREEAVKRLSEVLRVFVPGNMGTLTWTDGEVSRSIGCRTDETPLPTEIMPYLFRLTFSLVADKPYWYDTVENSVVFSGTSAALTNDCGLPVPFRIEVPAGGAFAIVQRETGDGLALVSSLGEPFTVDTESCTVTTSSGESANRFLSPESRFFRLIPGVNTFSVANSSGCVLKWRRAYMGVY